MVDGVTVSLGSLITTPFLLLAALRAVVSVRAAAVGRQAKSQAKIYQVDLEHANKVLSMQDDKVELVELQEVVEVVITAKLMTKVVTVASATITAAAL
uniref:Uncharacterized protein n=1 Tax=Tanacetum cinerariifolium TaxID=118510 RepID=A0A699QCP8_TANCI|nr:hypothetical protein [Tanacetum cinerariifolium]